MNFLINKPWPLAYLGLAIVSGAELGSVSWVSLQGELVTSPAPSLSSHQIGSQLPSIPQLNREKPSDLKAAIGQPLFSPSRLPFLPATPKLTVEPVVQPAAQPLPNIQVDAITKRGDLVQAHLKSPSGDISQWVKVEQVFQGWQVKSIVPDKVKLSNGATEFEISLYPIEPH